MQHRKTGSVTMLQFLSSRLRMAAQLKALLRVVDRLEAEDTGIAIPFLGQPTDAGRIETALEALRRRLIEAEGERRTAEQVADAMRDSEARYRLLAENTADMVIQYDLDFRPLYVSPSVKGLGYEPGKLLAEGILGIIDPDDVTLAATRREAVAQGRLVKPAIGRIRAADGRWVWIESTITPMFDDAGERVGFISTLRDIGERQLAEQALIASEARYRLLAENTGDIVIQYDLDFRPIYVSPSVTQLGYAPDVLVTYAYTQLIHPDDQSAALARREAARRGEPVKPIAGRILMADGSWKWFESTLTHVIDHAGERVGFISTLRDIGERKLAEQALIDSEARYRMLADNVSDVLLRYGLDQTVDYVSPSVRQWGYRQEDFLGQPIGHFVHPDDQERVAERRSALLRGERLPSGDCRVLRADGGWIWAESNPSLIRDESGTVLGILLVLRDISARKAAEAALIESEARYRMLADNTSDIIQTFNAEGIVEYVSPSVRQLGYEPEFFIGRPTAQLVESEDLPDVVRRRQDILSGKAVPPMEARSRTADGRTVWLESRPSSIFDANGKLVGVVNVMRDVTERKAAETALQELNLELRRVARASALGAFAGSLAHEINQPLAAAAVNGEAALRWLTADPVNYERGLQATRRAVEAVRRAGDVIGRLRALVTKEEPNRAPFDAHDAIVEVLALTALEAERSSVTVDARLDAQQPAIVGDRVQFQQVVINLVLNAIEALRTMPGARLLVVGSRDQAGEFEVFVEDRGPGIETDKQALIFDSLFTTKIGGTGLGLAIAKSIVESHGGAISMTPATPHGALFSVRLPRPAKAGLRSA